jgi:urease accessory protein
MAADELPTQAASGWHAFLNLNFAHTSRGVRLVSKAHKGPLYVQKPFYPEGLNTPHVYLLHPPGGMVSGDELSITVNAAENASVLVTTPGAGRLYKSRSDRSVQKQIISLKAEENANIEWLPLEAIFFPDANAEINTTIELGKNAKTIYWDVISLGLPANNEGFDSGAINQNFRIFSEERLVLQERLVINDSNRNLLKHGAGFANNPVQGVMIAGPFSGNQDSLMHEIQAQCEQSELTAAVTQVGEFVVVRTIGACSERARTLLEQAWALIRPALLNKEACAPRIWKT